MFPRGQTEPPAGAGEDDPVTRTQGQGGVNSGAMEKLRIMILNDEKAAQAQSARVFLASEAPQKVNIALGEPNIQVQESPDGNRRRETDDCNTRWYTAAASQRPRKNRHVLNQFLEKLPYHMTK